MEIRLPFTSFLRFVLHVVTIIQSCAVRQSGNFRQMVNDTYRSYRTKIPNQNFRNFFINGKQPETLVGGASQAMTDVACEAGVRKGRG